MNATLLPTPSPATTAEKALALALRLAHAENALQTLTAGQVDAIVDPLGRAYLLRPAQERLRQNERRLQAIFDSLADAITVVDRGGIIVSQNRAVRHLLGCEPEEMVGSSFFAWVHEADWPQSYAAFFNVIEEFRPDATLVFRHRARDGSYRSIEARVAKLRDASPQSVVFSLRLVSSLPRERHELAQPSAFDMAPSGEGRECIILSHGRRISLTDAPVSTVFV